jgi:hypothetical protein
MAIYLVSYNHISCTSIKHLSTNRSFGIEYSIHDLFKNIEEIRYLGLRFTVFVYLLSLACL